MRDRFSDRLELKVIEDRIVDPESGFELVAKRVNEVVRSADGLAIESKEIRSRELLDCSHLKDVGTTEVRCEICSKRAHRPVFVCESCAKQCPITGVLICRKHAVLAPDGRYYSRAGRKKAKRMGLFSGPQSQIGESKPTGLLGAIVAFLRHW